MVAAPSTAMTARDAVSDLEDLKRRRTALQLRLEDGYQRIEQALKDGKDVTRWEDFWIQLLYEYVRICDTIRELLPLLSLLPPMYPGRSAEPPRVHRVMNDAHRRRDRASLSRSCAAVFSWKLTS